MDDWMQKLESTFTNIDIAFSGGESTKQATDRIPIAYSRRFTIKPYDNTTCYTWQFTYTHFKAF